MHYARVLRLGSCARNQHVFFTVRSLLLPIQTRRTSWLPDRAEEGQTSPPSPSGKPITGGGGGRPVALQPLHTGEVSWGGVLSQRPLCCFAQESKAPVFSPASDPPSSFPVAILSLSVARLQELASVARLCRDLALAGSPAPCLCPQAGQGLVTVPSAWAAEAPLSPPPSQLAPPALPSCLWPSCLPSCCTSTGR